MRSHGVPNFPDPAPGGGFALRTSGINFGAPAYLTAYNACVTLLPGGTARPAITEAQQQGMIAKARCLREHAVPNFPDPFFGPGGEGVGVNLPSGWNPHSPAVNHAAKTCLHVGTLIPGTGVG